MSKQQISSPTVTYHIWAAFRNKNASDRPATSDQPAQPRVFSSRSYPWHARPHVRLCSRGTREDPGRPLTKTPVSKSYVCQGRRFKNTLLRSGGLQHRGATHPCAKTLCSIRNSMTGGCIGRNCEGAKTGGGLKEEACVFHTASRSSLK